MPAERDEEQKPFVAPCRILRPGAPFVWLRKGLEDYRRARRESLLYGVFLVGLSWLVVAAAWTTRRLEITYATE